MAILKRAKVSIKGLPEDLLALTQGIAAEELARQTEIGDLANLTTTEKANLVVALNEVLTTVTELPNTSIGSLKADQNLSDVEDIAVARLNLEVMSEDEVAQAIRTAKLALGVNYSVADIEARDALTDLSTSDRVFVADDGDGKWAMYVPTDVTEGNLTWAKISDQDSLENAISAPAIKAAYESNEDTNAFTDAEKAKVLASLTSDDLTQEVDPLSETAATEVPSVSAVSAFVEDRIGAMTDTAILKESLVVAGDTITLSYAPKNGVNGILNFATVRHIDGEGVAFDAPVIATGVAEEYTISVDVSEQWDGLTVQVQYLHEVV